MTHYFSEKQDSPLELKKIKSYLRGNEFEFYSGSGVFSKDKVDLGSDVLVNAALIEDGWRVLDLGCGYGVVGVVIKRLYPDCDVVMVDINSRAVKLAKMNLKLNKVAAEVWESNCYANVNGKFNTIIVNPPQKAGKEVCFSMITGAKEHLASGGLLQLVARHQKGGKSLEAKMKEVFGNVEVLARESGYRVYMSKK